MAFARWLLCLLLLALPLGGALAQEASPAAKSSSVAAAKPAPPRASNALAAAKKPSTETDWFGRGRSLFGLFLMLGIAFLMSNNRKAINWRLIAAGLSLQVVLGVVTLTPPGQKFFGAFNTAVSALLNYTTAGSSFLFGNLARQNNVPVGRSVVPMPPEPAGAKPTEAEAAAMAKWEIDASIKPILKPAKQPWAWAPIGAFFAFGVLPTIIFFSSLMAILYHLGVMQWLVRGIAAFMQKTMNTSGAETLSAAGNIFVGQTEAPLLVRPFLKEMTLSELMAVMTGGFATVAGGVMVAYVGMLKGVFPDIAGHLLSASIMSAPAALIIAKMIIPEPDPEASATYGQLKLDLRSEDANIIDAAARGAAEGLKLALNVGAMLLAFVALVAMLNGIISGLAELLGAGAGWTMQRILGILLSPLAWCMGVPWDDAQKIGSLLGIKTIVNEFVAYLELARIAPGLVHHRSMVIATYALCGFANLGSIAIQIGGISPLAPERRSDLARIGMRAMIGGTLAAFTTACVIGMFT